MANCAPMPNSAAAVDELARVQAELEAVPSRGSVLWRMLAGKPDAVRGMYMWGGVGRGKSMLMDLFHDSLAIKRKRRAHFHAFMQDVHAMLREERRAEKGDPIPPVAARIAADVRCLCFDEMVVNNSADAMIMSRLFAALMEDENVTVITTSNRPPRDLYKDGLNREHFLPFIELVTDRMAVVPLNGPTDYRMERMAGLDSWHTPLGEAATAKVTEAFFRMTDFDPGDADHVPSAELEVSAKRTIHVPKSLKGVAVFSFKRLCVEPRGAKDYLAIARAYHTVIIVGIPKMGRGCAQRGGALRHPDRRFVRTPGQAVRHCRDEPDALYTSGDGSFEFDRTVSRLMEMQSAEYMALGHGTDG